MNPGNYSRTVEMACPTCGGVEFEHHDDMEVEEATFTCYSCKKVFNKQALIDHNGENIDEHIQEIGQEVLKDLHKEMRKKIKSSLKSQSNIKIR